MTDRFKRIARISAATAKQWVDTRKASEVETRTCPQCGAPRPTGTDIRQCSYCGFQFMDDRVNVDPAQDG